MQGRYNRTERSGDIRTNIKLHDGSAEQRSPSRARRRILDVFTFQKRLIFQLVFRIPQVQRCLHSRHSIWISRMTTIQSTGQMLWGSSSNESSVFSVTSLSLTLLCTLRTERREMQHCSCRQKASISKESVGGQRHVSGM